MKYFFWSIFIFLVNILEAQPVLDRGRLPVTNFSYSKKGYDAQPQNKAIVQDYRGVIYVANDAYLLEYDGENWHKVYESKDLRTRSLLFSRDGIMYVGLNNDFGFLKYSVSGKTVFQSLRPDSIESGRIQAIHEI
ncbi:MAG: hypothetical protein MRY83_21680, partial [Flavobacteriales bacterium]|nr:hypothetical protein [Flavobacteriales bacterium]